MTEPKLYRKKPVVVEVMGPIEQGNRFTIADWCDGMISHLGLSIPTLEGVMTAEYGDYIIRGVAGEHYPCKPGIFHATYEVDE